MIKSHPTIPRWQEQLSKAITEPSILLKHLDLPLTLLESALQASRLFPLRVPQVFVNRMKKGDIADPLLRQVLPLHFEMENAANFVEDPLQETVTNPLSGLLHKYHGRVLLTLTGSCAIHCRYCFRRHFSYQDNNPGREGWKAVWSYIREHPDISEVILSGGDPLVMSDNALSEFLTILEDIPHVHTLRFHTRLPIVLPDRITDPFLACFENTRLKKVCVIHCNHAQEIDESVITAVNKLGNAGFILLNQSVLLRGVNDNAKTLIDLSQALFKNGILPYYLHQLDKVKGAHHFEVPVETAKAIMTECRNTLPGYLVPRYVSEKPGEKSKILLEY
ncbi:MAG: epmB [Gammaproteobacteria bacterium]|jgi:EF-P beta-lysylation protein EpmB|nr:epmB [Gammaproteobacteria bacterium]